ncbi:MAG: low-specificity L-threonine aldolase [Gammaproteobacteria bacterium]|nr:MAG: low-specificity L-threonine aldolase [Gammaproteobacteria bacterium]
MIDLRSDTVTKPTTAMRKAMAEAEVGDDVYGDDPSVNALQELAAELLGKEAALFLPSGTQSNLVALMAHCERGDEYIVGQQAHTYRYEGGGAAVLGSVVPQPLDFDDQGRIPLAKIVEAIKPNDPHFARTRLLCLENTWNGKVVPQDYIVEATQLARQHGLRCHLDGARLANASVESGQSLSILAAPFDSVSLCLSKGLGAPVGSVLAGSVDLIERARRWRKVLGGGMRQAGVLAAAGRIALLDGMHALADDHRRAKRLAQALAEMSGYQLESQATNMVFVRVDVDDGIRWAERLRELGVLVNPPSNHVLRLVLHRDIDDDKLERAISALSAVAP